MDENEEKIIGREHRTVRGWLGVDLQEGQKGVCGAGMERRAGRGTGHIQDTHGSAASSGSCPSMACF